MNTPRHTKTSPWAVAMVSAGIVAACGGDPGAAQGGGPTGVTRSTFSTLVVRTVPWNPSSAMLGHVAAVAEFDNGAVFFSDAGAVVMVGGAVTVTDTSARTWRAAASVPALDGSSTPWVLGVDGSGHVWRLASHTALADVSDRYGLAGMQVRSAAALGPMSTGFGFDGGFAIAAGATVTVYTDGAFATTLSGGNGRVAGIAGAGPTAAVRVFDPMAARMVSYPLTDASLVAFNPMGHVVVAAGHGLYAEDATGTLQLRYESTGTDTVHGLAVSAGTVWFSVGAELGTLQDDGTVRRTTGANVSVTARLVSSPSGDVWTLSDGAVGRYGVDTMGQTAVMAWEQSMRPIFLRVCASCHLPGGTAGIDLSTYSAWDSRRARILARVVTQRNMPPAGGPILPDTDREAVRAWASAMPRM